MSLSYDSNNKGCDVFIKGNNLSPHKNRGLQQLNVKLIEVKKKKPYYFISSSL